jgi:hypothetical protein
MNGARTNNDTNASQKFSNRLGTDSLLVLAGASFANAGEAALAGTRPGAWNEALTWGPRTAARTTSSGAELMITPSKHKNRREVLNYADALGE